MAATPEHTLRPASWPWTRQDQRQIQSSITKPSEHPVSSHSYEEKSGVLTAQQTIDCEATAAHPAAPNRGLWTRDLYIVGLILCWGAALASLSTGIYTIASGPVRIPPFLVKRVVLVGSMGYSWAKKSSPYINDHRVYGVSEAAMVIIPLALQFALTCIFACLDGIHSTTLRWALWREGRLRHNTNLRLFTSSKRNGPNSWPANLASALSLVFAYGGATVLTFSLTTIAALELERLDADPEANPVNYDADLGPDRFAIDFNAWGLLGLGAGLLIQSSICTWCLVDESVNQYVETWDSNPLATAKACRYMLDASEDPLCVNGDGAESPTRPALGEPSWKQASMHSLIPATRKIANGIWTVFAIYAALVIVDVIVASRFQDAVWSREDVRSYRGTQNAEWSSTWLFFGQITFEYSNNSFKKRREWIGLLIQCAAIAILLIGLHLAEVLGQLARDEAIWRRATTRRGASTQSSMLWETLRSWPSCLVFVCKSLVPWIFSYGFSCLTRVFLVFYPLLTVALLFMVLGLFAEYIIRIKPRGPQPATYGDIRALVALVDDWKPGTLFWGDKGVWMHGQNVRVAGTAGQWLDDLRPGAVYKGLDRELAPR